MLTAIFQRVRFVIDVTTQIVVHGMALPNHIVAAHGTAVTFEATAPRFTKWTLADPRNPDRISGYVVPRTQAGGSSQISVWRNITTGFSTKVSVCPARTA